MSDKIKDPNWKALIKTLKDINETLEDIPYTLNEIKKELHRTL